MTENTSKIIFSGIQPTGDLHLGNYLGAIKNWQTTLDNNSQDQCIFMIADMHSVTIRQNPADLKKNILQTFAAYLACGFDNRYAMVFCQSMVPQHSELAWILSCNCPIGWLDRMTQYKDKTTDNKERACLGLYSYPILMAADILLYNTNIVPVGEDQVQHIELTRDIAIRINNLYETQLFTVPEYKLTKAKRIMSLRDGTKKMSKSDTSDMSRINITDDPDTIIQKFKKATTGDANSPEVKNLLNIYNAISGKTIIAEQIDSYQKFKTDLADIVITELAPIAAKIQYYMSNLDTLEQMLRQSSQNVEQIASGNIKHIKTTIFGL